MKIEIHTLQSFPPANLNRDENGMPKSTIFGGYPRARISSQCQKRAVREFYHENCSFDASLFANRSRSENWIAEIATKLEAEGIDSEQSGKAAACVVTVFTDKKETKGKRKKSEKKVDGAESSDKADEKGDTILFLGNTEVQSIVHFLKANWQKVEADISVKEPALSKEIVDGIKATVEVKNKPGDVALFGRMMANLPSGKVDAAVQMSHAIGVNKLQQEFDFFTAVNELSRQDGNGADHLGETGYNSSTYYRFTNIDLQQLETNLGSSVELENIVKAFANAFIQAIPTGHQNSFAAHSLPALVTIIVRKGQPISLADAFEMPIRPGGEYSLLDNAVKAIDQYWLDLNKMYSDHNPEYLGVITREALAKNLKSLQDHQKESVNAMIDEAFKAAVGGK
jgi:CRISPR system Cascade subunit CasC